MEQTRRNALAAAIRSATTALMAGFLLTLASPAAHAQANLTFSGGSGSPLTITLNTSVSYTITNTTTAAMPVFVFQAVGNPINGFNGAAVVTMSSLLNGGAPLTINDIVSGFNIGTITVNDLMLTGMGRDLSIGDTITLTLGSVATANTIAAPAPANGSYSTFLTDSLGVRISTNGITTGGVAATAPEPGSLCLLAESVFPLMGLIMWRRRP